MSVTEPAPEPVDPSPTVSPRTVAALLGVVALGLYLATFTADHTHDAVFFAGATERALASGPGFLMLYHPHHVLYNPFGALLLAGAQAVGLPLGGMAVLQLLSAVSGAALVSVTMLRLVGWGVRPALAAATSSCLGVSAGTWFFATEAECNLPSLLLLVLALGPALRGLETGSARTLAAAAILLGLAAAFHLTLGTAWIALLIEAAIAGRRVLGRCVVMLGGASVVLGLAYLPRGWLLWTVPREVSPLELVLFSGVRPRYLHDHGFHPWAELLETLRGFVAGDAGACRLVALVLAAVPLAWTGVGVAGLVRGARQGVGGRVLRVAGLWGALSFLLYANWAYRNFEFTAFQLVPLAVFGAVGLQSTLSERLRGPAAVVLGVAAVAVGLANAHCLILPGLDPAQNEDLQTCELIEQHTSPADPVALTSADGRLKVYVPYYARRRIVIVDQYFGTGRTTEEALAVLGGVLRDSLEDGGTLHALPSAVEPGKLPEDARAAGELLRSLAPVPVAEGPEGVRLYRLGR